MEDYNEYMRVYHLKRYYRRKKEIVDSLGGKCVKCGTKDKLEIDHIDRKSKSFSVTLLLSFSNKKVVEEIKKCQLLCEDCHMIKTITEQGKKMAKGTHGTLSSYRYCKCDKCKKAKADYWKVYKARLVERPNGCFVNS